MLTDERIILLVEDNPDDEFLTLRAFKKSNIKNKVIVAHDGQEALDMLLGRDGNRELVIVPELILLDLKLPKIDGLDVLRAIRKDEETKLYPVVVLTSSKEEQDVLESYNLGANSYIRNPVDFLQFAEAIRQLEMYWLVLNERPRNKA